jgi:predicted tellurium resistance membrane protein TerC
LFGAGLWFTAGPITAEEYFAGYIVEKSLSVDNLFVFLLLFDYFQVPRQYQSRVLTWGIYGSVIMRTIMIGLGATALQNFHGILLVFASILIYSAIQVLVDVEEEIMEQENDLSGNPIVKFSTFLCESSETCNIDDFEDKDLTNPVIVLSRSLLPSTNKFDGDRFFTMEDGIKKATPLFVCMIAVELSDVVFAVDSIPAVFGVTENTLVVFSSNMFAILGLRSLYPVLSKAATDLKYLEPAVALILAFIGAKMIAEYFGYIIPTEAALAVIISLLSVGVGASVLDKMKNERDGTNDLT